MWVIHDTAHPVKTSRITSHNTNESVILFDGFCHLCNGAVSYILKQDKKKQFRFALLSSTFAADLFRRYDQLKDVDSIIFIANGQVYTRSAAVLRIFRMLGGMHALLYAFIIIPPFIRDRLYAWIAANRYQWFGKYDQCMVPTPEVLERFLS